MAGYDVAPNFGRPEHYDQSDRGGPLGIVGNIQERQPLENFGALRAVRLVTVDASARNGRIIMGRSDPSWLCDRRDLRVAKGEPPHIIQKGRKREVKYGLQKRNVEVEPLDDDDRAEIRAGMPRSGGVVLLDEEMVKEENRDALCYAMLGDMAREHAFMFNPTTSPFDNVTTLADLTGNPQWTEAGAKPGDDILHARNLFYRENARYPDAFEIQWACVEALALAGGLRTPERPDPLATEEIMLRLAGWARLPREAITIAGTLADTSAPGSRLPEFNNLFEPAFRFYTRGSNRLTARMVSGKLYLSEPVTSVFLAEDMLVGYGGAANDFVGLGLDFEAATMLKPLGLGDVPILAYLESRQRKGTHFEMWGFYGDVPVFPRLNATVGGVVPLGWSGPVETP